ncbi:MAG TPA: DipZ protein [Solirubrobacteraceae bacterium]|nr:DipZ protein [Solirubrobacteraceae bacterium]
MTRAPVDTIALPPFPPGDARWINSEPLTIEALRGRVVLVEFWDFCRVNSLRTLPYLRAWHERYAAAGLIVVSVHTPGFRASANDEAARAAVARLSIEHAVLLDTDYALWHEYENAGWPGRYLWTAAGLLFDYHYGEGDYAACEGAICELLGVDCEPLEPFTPADSPGARFAAPTPDRIEPPFSGPYEAGAAWGVLEPPAAGGSVSVNGTALAVEHTGVHLLAEHAVHTRAELELELGPGVRCDAVCFTAGLVASSA